MTGHQERLLVPIANLMRWRGGRESGDAVPDGDFYQTDFRSPRRSVAITSGAGGRNPRVALADPYFKARLVDLVSSPMPMTPVEFGKLIADETEKWAKVFGQPISKQ
jgi:hypothetical protein